MAIDCLLGERGHSRRDLTVNRYVGYTHLLNRGDESTGLARVAVQKTFPLQRVDVLHDRGLARKTEMMLDLARAGGNPFLALLRLDELQDVSLPLREHPLPSWRTNGVQV